MPDYPVQFLPECHADTALIRFLLPNFQLSIHAQGCTEVAKTMMSSRADEYNLVGIVDNDKKLNVHCKGFFREFGIVDYQNNLFVRRNSVTNQHIIVVDKAIESFLLWNAAEKQIDIGQYGFDATSVKRFGLQLKTPTIETDPEYHRLLTDLYNLKAPGFLTLERILNDFLAP